MATLADSPIHQLLASKLCKDLLHPTMQMVVLDSEMAADYVHCGVTKKESKLH